MNISNARTSADYNIVGLGLVLIGATFLIAAFEGILLIGGSSLLGVILVLIGMVLILLEYGRLREAEKRFLTFGIVVYLVATLLSVISGVSVRSFSPYLTLMYSGHAVTAPTVQFVTGMAALMVIGTLLYVSYFIFIHGLSSSEHKSLLWLGLLGGLFISIFVMPVADVLQFYHIGGFGQVVSILKGVVNIIFGIAYILIGIDIRK